MRLFLNVKIFVFFLEKKRFQPIRNSKGQDFNLINKIKRRRMT